MRTCQGNTFRYGFEFRLPRRAQECVGSVLEEDPEWIPLLCPSQSDGGQAAVTIIGQRVKGSPVSCTCCLRSVLSSEFDGTTVNLQQEWQLEKFENCLHIEQF